MLNLALNGRILEGALTEEDTLESLAESWQADANRIKGMEFHFSSARQIVSTDSRYGSVLTAWADNPRDGVKVEVLDFYEERTITITEEVSVTFQVVEMG